MIQRGQRRTEQTSNIEKRKLDPPGPCGKIQALQQPGKLTWLISCSSFSYLSFGFLFSLAFIWPSPPVPALIALFFLLNTKEVVRPAVRPA